MRELVALSHLEDVRRQLTVFAHGRGDVFGHVLGRGVVKSFERVQHDKNRAHLLSTTK